MSDNQTVAGQTTETTDQTVIDKIIEDAGKGKAGGNDIKQEGQNASLYEQELAKQRELIAHKNRAIEAQKKEIAALKSKPAETNTPAETPPAIDMEEMKKSIVASVKDEIKKEFDGFKETMTATQLDSQLAALTADPHERELIKLHYQNSIQKTGDVVQDLKRARLLANESVIYNEGLQKGLEAKREEVMANLSSAGLSGRKVADDSLTGAEAQAANILNLLGPETAAKVKKFI